ncbi:NADH-quinone oxidoreductase subunit C [Aquirufa regiilacus]|uniref:NADH-quinone oxidoreductase subunit C n=1 Tax=Aquirufa regiilacus TaxID=3024868 RepID=A0ABU3TU86_9BACT|nr:MULTISPECIES: NADH-quinone oxidoreductase subunit C [unclassified Aquirufa]MDT8887588.1 NADH-quinone oxidoreductase subunit C [Aquirufa sp. LEPPI-3A]MDU0809400.1 NADH-quinone oxidoreductase subunit C [Aquirufa sp. LEOWEIH-7C]
MDLLEIKALLENELKRSVELNEKSGQLTLHTQDLVAVCDFLWRNPTTYFDSLSCVTAIDLGVDSGQMEVIYTLYSIPFHVTLHLRVVLDREKPEVPSLSGIWKTADWHEREAFDFFGIQFIGHPNLTRILLPADWEGHPLRKDYVEQERYHGIKVKYEG